MSHLFDVIKNMEIVTFDDKKMPMRNKFAKSELDNICEKLDLCYDKIEVIRMDDNNRFFKILELMGELSKKTSNLKKFLKEEV